MPNMSLKKIPIPEQEPDVRNKNFSEVALGYTPDQALEEAERCLNCKNPVCIEGCPVAVPIPQFISKIKEGDMEGSYKVLSAANALPAVCGRVCPQETQCECKCVRGKKGEPVAIGRLERYVADWALKNKLCNSETAPKNGRKVAIIGSGPGRIDVRRRAVQDGLRRHGV